MRLIDADALKNTMQGLIILPPKNSNEIILTPERFINDCPTIDAYKVIHAYWVYDNDATDFGIGGYVCSECGVRNNNLPTSRCKNPLFFSGSKFCPNCGAKMDGKDD